jgi:hypothetical protein
MMLELARLEPSDEHPLNIRTGFIIPSDRNSFFAGEFRQS